MAASTRNTYLSPILANNNLILSNWKLSNYSHWISRHIILFVKVSCHTYTSICEIKDIFPPAPANIWPCHHLLWLISPEVTTQVSTKEKSTEKRFFWLMFDATFFPSAAMNLAIQPDTKTQACQLHFLHWHCARLYKQNKECVAVVYSIWGNNAPGPLSNQSCPVTSCI